MRNVLTYAALFALTSCAGNVVRLERASAVSTQAGAVTGAVDAYVADAQARRREANIALVASDPSCSWGDRIVVDTMSSPERGLCDMTGVPPERRMAVSLLPIAAASLRPVVLAVAGLATFQAGLAQVLEAEPDDARQEIDDAAQTLSTAATDINRIAGEKVVDLGPLTGERSDAVVALIDALVELRRTDLKVGEVSAIMARTDTARLYADLGSAVTRLDRLQGGNTAAWHKDAINRVLLRDARKLGFAERRDLIRQLATIHDDEADRGVARRAVLTDAIKKLTASDAQLRRALAGDFTPQERRRIARDNRKQAFDLLTKIAAVFPAA